MRILTWLVSGALALLLVFIMAEAFLAVPAPACSESSPYPETPVGLRRIHLAFIGWIVLFSAIWAFYSKLYSRRAAYTLSMHILLIARDALFIGYHSVFLVGVFVLWQAAALENRGGCFGVGGSQIDNNHTELFIAWLLSFGLVPMLLITGFLSLCGVVLLRILEHHASTEENPEL